MLRVSSLSHLGLRMPHRNAIAALILCKAVRYCVNFVGYKSHLQSNLDLAHQRCISVNECSGVECAPSLDGGVQLEALPVCLCWLRRWNGCSCTF